MGKCKITPLLSMLVLLTLLFMLYDVSRYQPGAGRQNEHFEKNSRKTCEGNKCDPIEGSHKCVFRMKNGVFKRVCQ